MFVVLYPTNRRGVDNKISLRTASQTFPSADCGPELSLSLSLSLRFVMFPYKMWRMDPIKKKADPKK